MVRAARQKGFMVVLVTFDESRYGEYNNQGGKGGERSTTPIVRKLRFGVAYGLVGHMSLRGAPATRQSSIRKSRIGMWSPKGAFHTSPGWSPGFTRVRIIISRSPEGAPDPLMERPFRAFRFLGSVHPGAMPRAGMGSRLWRSKKCFAPRCSFVLPRPEGLAMTEGRSGAAFSTVPLFIKMRVKRGATPRRIVRKLRFPATYKCDPPL